MNTYNWKVTQFRRLQLVLALNILMLVGLVSVGLTSHSLGVLAAGGDYLLDSGAIVLGLLAIYVGKRDGTESMATSLVAFINVSLLMIISITVIVEAILRLSTHAPHIHALPVLWVSSIAALVMGVSLVALKDHEGDLLVRSILLDTMADALSAATIAISAVIILVTKRFFWIDSIAAILISTAIIYQASSLLRDIRKAWHS